MKPSRVGFFCTEISILGLIAIAQVFTSSSYLLASDLPEVNLCGRLLEVLGSSESTRRSDSIFQEIVRPPRDFVAAFNPNEPQWDLTLIPWKAGDVLHAQIYRGGSYVVIPPEHNQNIWLQLKPSDRAHLANRIADALSTKAGDDYRVNEKSADAIRDFNTLKEYLRVNDEGNLDLLKRLYFNEDALTSAELFRALELERDLLAKAEADGKLIGIPVEYYDRSFLYADADENKAFGYSPLRLMWAAGMGSRLPSGAPRAYVMAGILGAVGLPKRDIIIEAPAKDIRRVEEPIPTWVRIRLAPGEELRLFKPTGLPVTNYVDSAQIPRTFKSLYSKDPMKGLARGKHLVERDEIFLDKNAQLQKHREKMNAAKNRSKAFDRAFALSNAIQDLWVVSESYYSRSDEQGVADNLSPQDIKTEAQRLRTELLALPADSISGIRDLHDLLNQIESKFP